MAVGKNIRFHGHGFADGAFDGIPAAIDFRPDSRDRDSTFAVGRLHHSLFSPVVPGVSNRPEDGGANFHRDSIAGQALWSIFATGCSLK